MTRHYSAQERLHMDIQTLLASDPITWRTYTAVVEVGDD